MNTTQHFIPMDFNSAPTTLPESHTWRLTNPASQSGSGIPVIDISDPNSTALIRRASERWGAFQVTNHGVSGELLRRVELHTRRLFALPLRQKLGVARVPGSRTGYGSPPISPFFPKLMWSEGFSIVGSPAEHAHKLWPHQEECQRFSDVVVEYQKEMKNLSEKIMGLMIESLGLSQEDTKWARPNKNGLSHSEAFVRLNSYPICPDPTRAMGLGPHTDSSMITLLYQTNGGDGLQVIGEDEIGWVRVHPVDGAIVVIVADLMHILSNGRYKTALHRVVPSATRHRVSVSYFYGPHDDVVVAPLTQLVGFDRPALYRPVTWKEFRDAKSSHFTNAFELIKN